MALESFPVLKETSGRKVSQAEHTFIIGEKVVVPTRLDD
jgi:methionine aminopeptidase